MAGIVIELFIKSQLSMHTFGWKFLTSSTWDPVNGKFGALSSISGTIVTTIIALVIAVPMSLVVSIFLVELAPKKLSGIFGTAIELLAAIPSIIYGMWGLFVLVPIMGKYINPMLSKWFGNTFLFSGPSSSGLGILTAGCILALMVLPFITSVMRDILMMVPPVIKESAYGLGATTWEVTKDVSIPYGLCGMVGAVFLGLGRAIGETMAVTFVLANDHTLSSSLFAGGNTIASTLAVEFTEASDGLYLSSLVQLGLVLFLITAIFQIIAQVWLKYAGKNGGQR
jgi:phosphate transport system permease protein